MYGALTGLSKKKTRTIYGETQFKKWRRGYSIRPPPASSFSQHYPGNDQRYVDNVIDVRWSAKESLIRSLESGRVRLHRKLPRTESLKDCMDRTIPYYVNSIEGEAIAAGKSVLVASSENAIRGLLMHLLKIPQDRISDIEIPTGLPLVFDMRHRCLRLVEGDFSDYNFGKVSRASPRRPRAPPHRPAAAATRLRLRERRHSRVCACCYGARAHRRRSSCSRNARSPTRITMSST